ncbi:DUF397 domain-containing protein [Nocardiopsis mangrovi]|uniref:DUF397 domain-containing protein n=1 Tax=Nocardiopsis mangrovi TaxID=1179818 RepID=A0ABV9DTV6_9ACTN
MKDWHTSSYSANGGECVEVREGEYTQVRDTKHRDSGCLAFPVSEWRALLADIDSL